MTDTQAAPADDGAWFTGLVRDHQLDLRRYVARRVPPGEVDDVVSEVFAALWRARDDRPPQPRLWLYRSAHHVVLHEYRGRQRRERLTGKLAQQPAPAPVASDTDASEAVHAALEQLPAEDRELLRLHYWEQLPVGDLATVLELRTGTVRVRLHRARRRLAAALPEWLGPSPTTAGPALFDLSLNGARR